MLPTISEKGSRIDGTQVAEPRNLLHDLLQSSAALHNHLCPRQVLGVRMGMWAGELLALDLPQAGKRLLVIVESDGCFADGVAVATNCWIGRRTLRVEDYGKTAATFVDTETGTALRISPRSEVRGLAQEYAPDAANHWEAMLLGYQRIEAARLFRVQQVTLKTPLAQIVSRPGVRRLCERCGEEIINEREVTLGTQSLCRACAGHAYYEGSAAMAGTGGSHSAVPGIVSPGDVSSEDGSSEDGRSEVGSEQVESRVAQRIQQLVALFDINQEIAAQLDLGTLLGTISDHARTLLQAQAAMLCLLNAAGDTLQLAISSGWEEVQTGLIQPAAGGLAEQVIGSGLNVVSPAHCINCAVLRKFGPGSCIAVPLRAGEDALGALCVVQASEQAYDMDHARSLRLLANTAAIAITNARLAEAARQEAACAERERLTTELHDSLAQTLALLKLQAGGLESHLQEAISINGTAGESIRVELAAMTATISTCFAQVRAMLAGLQRPVALPDDLAGALAQSVDEFHSTTGIATELVIVDEPALALTGAVHSQIKHIVQEALTNIRRHAQATRVQVRVVCSNGTACFVITDDGCGFEPHTVDTQHHLGLAIMRRRAASYGGRLTIDSAPGAGTRIVASFPLEQRGKG